MKITLAVIYSIKCRFIHFLVFSLTFSSPLVVGKRDRSGTAISRPVKLYLFIYFSPTRFSLEKIEWLRPTVVFYLFGLCGM